MNRDWEKEKGLQKEKKKRDEILAGGESKDI